MRIRVIDIHKYIYTLPVILPLTSLSTVVIAIPQEWVTVVIKAKFSTSILTAISIKNKLQFFE